VLSRDLAQALAQRGQRVFALAPERSGALAAGEERVDRVEGVDVLRVGCPPRDFAPAELVRRPELERALLRWAASGGLDLVHLHSLDPWGVGVPSRLAAVGLPCVWTWHDYGPLCPRGQLWHVDGHACERAEPAACAPCVRRTWPELGELGRIEGALAERHALLREALVTCARVWTPSRGARAVLARHELPASIGLSENGVGAAGPAIVDRAEPPPSGLRVGVLGAVQPSKGVLELARWIVELGEPFRLEVHGPLGEYHGDGSCVTELANLTRTEPRVSLHPVFEPDSRADVLARLDLVAVPSLWEEVFGLVAREARAAGKAVFASEVGGLAESDAHLLPAGDRDAWQAALRRFAEDASWRAELEARGRPARSVGEMAEELLLEYRAVVEAGAEPRDYARGIASGKSPAPEASEGPGTGREA